MKITVHLDPEQLQELARLVVHELASAQLPERYDQEHLPDGLSRRAFLEASRRGDFPSSKVGRRVLALREDVDTWLAANPRPEPKKQDLEEVLEASGLRLVR